jgi:hypothetical protein
MPSFYAGTSTAHFEFPYKVLGSILPRPSEPSPLRRPQHNSRRRFCNQIGALSYAGTRTKSCPPPSARTGGASSRRQRTRPRVWDAATRKEIMALPGHEGGVTSDKTARIWDVHFATMPTSALLAEACARRLRGLSSLGRDDMRLLGYPDDQPEIDVWNVRRLRVRVPIGPTAALARHFDLRPLLRQHGPTHPGKQVARLARPHKETHQRLISTMHTRRPFVNDRSGDVLCGDNEHFLTRLNPAATSKRRVRHILHLCGLSATLPY